MQQYLIDVGTKLKNVFCSRLQRSSCAIIPGSPLWMLDGLLEEGVGLFVHHIPVLSCIFDLFQYVLHKANIAFAEDPEAISLKQG